MIIRAAAPDVVTLTAEEQQALSELSEQLEAHAGPGARVLVADPVALASALAVAARLFRPGKPVTVLDEGAELTTTQAAQLLQVSRQYLARLLDRGAIPHRLVGTHHRIQIGDLLAYRARRRAGVREIAQLSDEFGIYDE